MDSIEIAAASKMALGLIKSVAETNHGMFDNEVKAMLGELASLIGYNEDTFSDVFTLTAYINGFVFDYYDSGGYRDLALDALQKVSGAVFEVARENFMLADAMIEVSLDLLDEMERI